MTVHKKQKSNDNQEVALTAWRESLHTIIFGSETCLGKVFDIVLIISIICSVIAVMLNSVTHIQLQYGEVLFYIEWFFTFLFTIEYSLRGDIARLLSLRTLTSSPRTRTLRSTAAVSVDAGSARRWRCRWAG